MCVTQYMHLRVHSTYIEANSNDCSKGSDERHLELLSRLDEIASKRLTQVEGVGDKQLQFPSELPHATPGTRASYTQQSRKEESVTSILWNLDWTSWVVAQHREISLLGSSSTHSTDYWQTRNAPATLRILSDLEFSDMNSREETIRKAHVKTLQWILKDEEKDEKGVKLEWSSFPHWLRETTGSLYWVTGKPGSGKSTLMKFIFRHQDLSEHLEEYAQGLEIVQAGFFFWNPGSEMQKSYEGLLRTLLHQCLSVRRDMIPMVVPRRWALYNILGNELSATSWTISELEESFDTLCSYHGKAFRLLIFVDGLDELGDSEGSLDSLLRWVRDTTHRGIKVCVASRPEIPFKDDFQPDCCSLEMQRLTRRDIESFVREQFKKSRAFEQFESAFPLPTANLVNGIIKKAEGVFLWVDLVVRTFLATIKTNPAWFNAQKQLEKIPSDIMELYDSIWKKILLDKDSTASKIFQLYRAQDRDTTAQEFWLAHEEPGARAEILSNGLMTIEIGELLERLLNGQTRGICELVSGRVRLLHRSASEWMTKNWPMICEQAPTGFEPNLELLDSFLLLFAAKRSEPLDPRREDVFSFIKKCFERLRRIPVPDMLERIDEKRLVQIFDKINNIAQGIMKKGCKKGNISHQLAVKNANSLSYGEFSAAGWPTLVLGENITHIEFSFVGIAASAGFLPYVKAKVAADKNLLIPQLGRVSLLENTIFPDLGTVWNSKYSDADFLPHSKETADQRYNIIKFLLSVYDKQLIHRFRTAVGNSLLDAVYKAQEKRLLGELDEPEWYTRVLRLFESYVNNISKQDIKAGMAFITAYEKYNDMKEAERKEKHQHQHRRRRRLKAYLKEIMS